MTLFRGKRAPKKPPKRGVNRHFEAKLAKSKNCNISESIHPISPKFDDETHTINDMSWVVYHYRTGNTTWLTSAVLKIDITSWAVDGPIHTKFDAPMKNEMPMTTCRSK